MRYQINNTSSADVAHLTPSTDMYLFHTCHTDSQPIIHSYLQTIINTPMYLLYTWVQCNTTRCGLDINIHRSYTLLL